MQTYDDYLKSLEYPQTYTEKIDAELQAIKDIIKEISPLFKKIGIEMDWENGKDVGFSHTPYVISLFDEDNDYGALILGDSYLEWHKKELAGIDLPDFRTLELFIEFISEPIYKWKEYIAKGERNLIGVCLENYSKLRYWRFLSNRFCHIHDSHDIFHYMLIGRKY